MRIDYGPWLPDQPVTDQRVLHVARNVVPLTESGYGPFASLQLFSNALPAACVAAYGAQDPDLTVRRFAATSTKLYLLSGVAWTDVSKAGGSYTAAPDTPWKFAQFRNYVLGTNFRDPVQKWLLGTDAEFSDLSGDAPKAEHVAVWDPEFIVLGRTDDSGSVEPGQIWWSAIGDPTDWPTPGTAAAEAVQSDFRKLAHGDRVTALAGPVGGAAGVVFTQNAIYRADYEGPPTVFRLTRLEATKGTRAPRSVINIGEAIYYLAEDGFRRFDGISSQPIGNQAVDKTFFAEFDQFFNNQVLAASDPINEIVLWAYPQRGAATPDKIIMYNYAINRWSDAEVSLEWFGEVLSRSYSLDDLDSIFPNLDEIQVSLDSRAWLGGAPVLAGFDTDHRMGFFGGSTLTAMFETGDFGGMSQRHYVSSVRPISDGTSTVSMGRREALTDDVSYSTATGPGVDGACPQRSSGRYLRAKHTISGSWTEAMGLDVTVRRDGRR